jgi:ribonuclease E
MLIDASHPEETRVVVVNGNRLEDFDVEVESRKQLKGNIYLAKVTRVEPSLQAAFVDYGGNRHGFLAFSEIHPDYYQIPVADREALIAEDEAEEADEADDDAANGEDGPVETLGGDDADEVESRRPHHQRRNYKIQEVIKRRQVLLIQVVKEERGTKGAALTTYLSLAGRYCVLMPNTARGGGISRKISNGADRKRLKTIVNDLGIPHGMAVIVRTAGAKRSKAEIKRDYEYMIRLWGQIRDLTLESTAPCIVHEEGDLIKRSIRDLYSKEIEEVVVAGEDGYRAAKDFMKLLIPSHAKKVQRYTEDSIPLMQSHGVEGQLDVMHSPEVHLKSGGYIVINPTEALVSIDVNSGKATKERNIEETALKTNMEAAEEIARQLKLRDLAGLIVIDFIDMEVSRNQTRVERQIKDAMRNDRARIQIGRISPFGLLELSRQRLRPSLIETSSEPCPYCEGTGIRRSTDSTALHMLRVIEEECMRKKASSHTVFVPTAVALYLLNHKRPALADIESRYETSIFLENDDTLIPPAHRMESSDDLKIVEAPKKTAKRDEESADPDGSQDASKRRRRRRRGKRKRTDGDESIEVSEEDTESNEEDDAETPQEPQQEAGSEDDEGASKRRRRGRRGGRRKGRKDEVSADGNAGDENAAEPQLLEAPEEKELLMPPSADGKDAIALPDESDHTVTETEEAPAKPKRRRRKAKPKADAEEEVTKEAETETPVASEVVAAEPTEPEAAPEAEEEKKKPVRRRRRKAAATEAAEEMKAETPEPKQKAAPEPQAAPEAETTNDNDSPPAAVVVEVPIEVVSVEEPAVEEPPVEEPKTPEVDDKVIQEAAKTTIINIEANDDSAPTRKGWWRR